MPNPNYLKGKRLEKEIEAWFRVLDPGCTRSFMSKGKDLVLTWVFRLWSVSAKSGKRKTISRGKILKELEEHDICVSNEDYDEYPLVSMYLPKFIEILGRAEEESSNV